MSYQKHVWKTHEIIREQYLNHIEDGIYNEEQRARNAEEYLEELIQSEGSRAEDAESRVTQDLTALQNGLTSVTNAVNTLNGSISTPGSVDYKIQAAMGDACGGGVIVPSLESVTEPNTMDIYFVLDSTTNLYNGYMWVESLEEEGYWVNVSGGASSLADLTDTTITNPSNGQILKFNGTAWVNDAAPSGNLAGLTDTTISSPINGQILKYNGSSWVNSNPEQGGHIIVGSDGTAYTQRSKLKFLNSIISDDSTNDVTIISPVASDVGIGDVTNVAYTEENAVVTFTWNDPDDIVESGVTLARWSGTKLVRKQGSPPESVNDGTVVLTSTTRNQYASTGFSDTGVTYRQTYYYRFFPYKTENNVNVYTPSVTVQLRVKPPIYGVEFQYMGGSRCTRIGAAQNFVEPVAAVNNGNGSSPFDDIFPWKDIKRVSDSNCGELVEIPKFYYKMTGTNYIQKIEICEEKLDGFLTSPAHSIKNGGLREQEKIYVGRYHCANSTYKSTTGVLPQNSQTRETFRTNIHNLDSLAFQFDYFTYWTILILYLVEYASYDSQATIGLGCGTANTLDFNGATDAMVYHTGTSAATRDTRGHVQYRYIEDMWANVMDWCDGIRFSGTTAYFIFEPFSYSDTTGGKELATGLRTGLSPAAPDSWKMDALEWTTYVGLPLPKSLLIPSSGSDYRNFFTCDAFALSGAGTTFCVGAGAPSGSTTSAVSQYGLFYGCANFASSYSSSNIGSRIVKYGNAFSQ